MDPESPIPAVSVRRQRNTLLVSLLALALAAWSLLFWQAVERGPTPDSTLTMGLGAGQFLGLWAAMVSAIMVPSAAPTILLVARSRERTPQRQQLLLPTWSFVVASLLVWTLMGVYVVATEVEHLAAQVTWLIENSRRLGGVLLLLAGLYQRSALKYRRLTRCRSPVGFVLASWRNGSIGGFRMGLEYGISSLGCCWLLLLILLPLGMLNLAILALLALLIYAENVLPFGWQARDGAAILLVVYGILVIVMPELLARYA